MTKRFLIALAAALSAAYAERPNLGAPDAIVTVQNFVAGTTQFFLVGDLANPRFQGGAVQTISPGGTSLGLVSIPDQDGLTSLPVAEVTSANLGVVTINIMSSGGAILQSFSANGQLIFGYLGSVAYPNELWVFGDFAGQAVTTILDFDYRTGLEPMTMGQTHGEVMRVAGNGSVPSGSLQVVDVASGDHLLTVCASGACDTIPVRVPGVQIR